MTHGEVPHSDRSYRQDLGVPQLEPGSRGEEMLKNRLMSSNEPWSTFALAESCFASTLVASLWKSCSMAICLSIAARE